MHENFIAWKEVNGFDVKLSYTYDEGVDYRDLFSDFVEFTTERIDGSSFKLNSIKRSYLDCDVWVTPKQKVDEYFRHDVESARLYFKKLLTPYVLRATAYYKGVELGYDSLSGFWSGGIPRESDFTEYGIISEAVENAKYKLAELRAV